MTRNSSETPHQLHFSPPRATDFSLAPARQNPGRQQRFCLSEGLTTTQLVAIPKRPDANTRHVNKLPCAQVEEREEPAAARGQDLVARPGEGPFIDKVARGRQEPPLLSAPQPWQCFKTNPNRKPEITSRSNLQTEPVGH